MLERPHSSTTCCLLPHWFNKKKWVFSHQKHANSCMDFTPEASTNLRSTGGPPNGRAVIFRHGLFPNQNGPFGTPPRGWLHFQVARNLWVFFRVKAEGKVLGCSWKLVNLVGKLVHFTYLMGRIQPTYIGVKLSIDRKYQQDIPISLNWPAGIGERLWKNTKKVSTLKKGRYEICMV